MKLNFKYVKLHLASLVPLLLTGCIFFLFLHYWEGIESLISTLVTASYPILTGLVIAFLVNILMVKFEKLLQKRIKSDGARRTVSMISAFVCILAVLTAVIRLVVPQFIDCVGTLVQRAPAAIKNITEHELIKKYVSTDISKNLSSIDWNRVVSQAESILTSGLSSGVSQVMTGFSIVLNLVLGIIFALYFLTGKDRLLSQLGRMLRAYTKPAFHDRVFFFARRLNRSFRSYVGGQCTEAVIFGSLCALGMTLLRLPYATMIGTLAGMCALIPVVGSYIGAVTGFVMIASVSLPQAVEFIIFLIILVQLEGNLIYPRVVGSSVGLSGIWVLAAVTIFGALFGIPGMFIGVPVTSTLYQIIREDLHRREEEELPAAAPKKQIE